MDSVTTAQLKEFVNANIDTFHEARLRRLSELRLRDVLKDKNPYLFKAKNIHMASALIEDILNARLSSSEEKLFGDFLEKLAIFASSITRDGRKSTAMGLDLEFSADGVYYIVSIKSGTNWGNNPQHLKQRQDFAAAVTVLKQANPRMNIQPTLGICYGKTRTSYLHNYMKVVGQTFWHLISGNRDFYTDIVEPLGYRAKEHNDAFFAERGRVVNTFTQELLDDFCTNGVIDWNRLVRFNSGNMADAPDPEPDPEAIPAET